jgi:hypothetical protein
LRVIEDVSKKYACACTVKTAGKPPRPIEKSAAGASLLAQVIVGKVADHLPLHRQAKIFRRFGVEIADQTLCGWMRQSAELLDPLYICSGVQRQHCYRDNTVWFWHRQRDGYKPGWPVEHPRISFYLPSPDDLWGFSESGQFRRWNSG